MREISTNVVSIFGYSSCSILYSSDLTLEVVFSLFFFVVETHYLLFSIARRIFAFLTCCVIRDSSLKIIWFVRVVQNRPRGECGCSDSDLTALGTEDRRLQPPPAPLEPVALVQDPREEPQQERDQLTNVE